MVDVGRGVTKDRRTVYISRRRDRWTIWMGGAGRSGDECEGLVWEGLGGLCEWLAGLVSRVCVYVDWRAGRSGAGL